MHIYFLYLATLSLNMAPVNIGNVPYRLIGGVKIAQAEVLSFYQVKMFKYFVQHYLTLCCRLQKKKRK